MKRDLDRARLKLANVTPETPQTPQLRVARQLSIDCTDEELATLLAEAVDQQHEAKRMMEDAEARMYVVMKARGLRHRG